MKKVTKKLGPAFLRDPAFLNLVTLGILLTPLLSVFLILGIIACIIWPKIAEKHEDKQRKAIWEKYDAEYDMKYEAAKEADSVAKAAYSAAVEVDQAKRRQEKASELAAIEEKIHVHIKNFESTGVPQSLQNDAELLRRMIQLIESGRADTIKECYAIIDEANRRNREEKRRKEEENQRQEEDRKRNSPGEVYVYVGIKHPYANRWSVPTNRITIDGQDYGAGDIPFKKIILQPGWHRISVMTQIGDSLYESDTIQFELEGSGKKYFQYYIDNSGHHFEERSSEWDLRRNP